MQSLHIGVSWILYEPTFSSWWFQEIWKICSSNWIIFLSRGENKKSLKPPPSFGIFAIDFYLKVTPQCRANRFRQNGSSKAESSGSCRWNVAQIMFDTNFGAYQTGKQVLSLYSMGGDVSKEKKHHAIVSWWWFRSRDSIQSHRFTIGAHILDLYNIIKYNVIMNHFLPQDFGIRVFLFNPNKQKTYQRLYII